jgi:hypothetical protein
MSPPSGPLERPSSRALSRRPAHRASTPARTSTSLRFGCPMLAVSIGRCWIGVCSAVSCSQTRSRMIRRWPMRSSSARPR